MSQSDLINEIDKILYQQWDPIGVNDDPLTLNEYSGYAGRIIRALEDGASQEHIAKLLNGISTKEMGLESDPVSDEAVAATILATYKLFS